MTHARALPALALSTAATGAPWAGSAGSGGTLAAGGSNQPCGIRMPWNPTRGIRALFVP